ncbi:ComEA family DNA-binding protein [Gracilimonas mengyeensis]|uniref:ComEA protein n=1 Tax=Gracilimonas mengyeensis TaxID=1302730 RepID=A0A521CPI3_9BACT|nr:helix-hairpin-helix domain-containing protein [Gracilimonas mengyeensis]SMO61342.1 comEA protein [Gracilimonas mengyeensis]
MGFKKLKRSFFFWMEKLQISRSERIAFSVLLAVLGTSFLMHFFLNRSFNYDQQQYDEIMAEFDRRSAELKQKKEEIAEKYLPDTSSKASNEQADAYEPEDSDQPKTEEAEPSASDVVYTSETININTANSQQLQQLDGIGPAYARRIIEYRESNGGFETIDELLNVKGIGEKRLAGIRPFIKLEN